MMTTAKSMVVALVLASAGLTACGSGNSANNAAAANAPNQIPQRFHGRWRYNASDCAQGPGGNVIGMDVFADRVEGSLSVYTVTGVETRPDNRIMISATRTARNGSEPPQPDTLDFAVSADGNALTWTLRGDSTPLPRCR
jgi:hypothetical protein